MSDLDLPDQIGTSPDDYGKAYYSHYGECDQEYAWSSPHWRDFFLGVASRIVAVANPSKVLDVGCAKGMLVQALCEQGVEAYGVDVSGHAVESADPAVRERLSVGSAASVGGAWDLVTWIEVAEHMSPADAEAALDAICAATGRVLFSSTPGHFGDPTHVNVRPPAAWAASFAERGFFRRTDVDLAFLSPWAVLFERSDPTVRDVVHRYEQWAQPLRSEVLEKRAALLEAGRALAEAREGGAPGGPVSRAEHDAVVAELRDARHRLLTLRDHVIGAEAQAGTMTRRHEKVYRRMKFLEDEVARVETERKENEVLAVERGQQLAAILGSPSRRIARLLRHPSRVLSGRTRAS